jgi:hypothetical protein
VSSGNEEERKRNEKPMHRTVSGMKRKGERARKKAK